jgi:hypothetical protein
MIELRHAPPRPMRVKGRIQPLPKSLSDLAQPKPKCERLWSDVTSAFPKHYQINKRGIRLLLCVGGID